ncbi:MAG TPA: helix-hairpin-helix domain-containing protein [Gammaproteobacteria bacterium]|jgi:competence ComEA-like helix-hairpin-helix protein|nr:helix-hairpin-helix domain-containing protein [Gammaproteobacteria bacterium]
MSFRQLIMLLLVFGFTGSIFAAQTNPNPAPIKPAQTEVAPAKINLNSATIKDLMRLKGLNRANAKNILTYRKKHGDFKSLDDLKLVKGFKKIKADQLKLIQDQLTL